MMIFEPRTEGHHLSWLRYITEDLIVGGFKLTLAVDYRPRAKKLIDQQLADLLPKIRVLSVYNDSGMWEGGNKLQALAKCFRKSGAHEIFMTNFDEIASGCLRRAAVGVYPPEVLQGRINGVYFRPRFLANKFWPVGNIIKAFGFRRLCQRSWFKNIYLADEYLTDEGGQTYAGPRFVFLPDPWSGNFSHDKEISRRKLNLPIDKYIFLHYGIGTRRKGLHLVIRTLLEIAPPHEIFLLCAGKLADDRELLQGLAELEKRGVAKIMNRYVTEAEEELCFSACDVVLLPYVKHFGSSGVLSRAAAAGKMVLASDEGLVAKRVKKHNLGMLFRTGKVESLRKAMQETLLLKDSERFQIRDAALRYATSCSRQAFRTALLNSFKPDFKRDAAFIKGNKLQRNNLRNILLIQFGDIGDVVYSFPCARALKENFPNARIVMALQKKAGGLAEVCSWVDEVIIVDKEKRSLWQEIIYQKEFWQRVRKFQFDLAIDLRTGSRGAILAFLSGARQRVGRYTYVGWFWRRLLFTHIINPPGRMNQSIAEYYLDTISEYGIRTENLNPEIQTTAEKTEEVAKLLENENVPQNKPIVAIQPCSLWGYKEWAFTKYVALIEGLARKFDISVIITGTPSERERSEEIVRSCVNRVYNLAGKTPLNLLPALYKRCELFLGVDSAGVHIAAAVGTPTVSLYGPSSSETWAPKGEKHKVISKDFYCVPCKETGCQGSMKSRCMDELTVDEVLPVVEKCLEMVIKDRDISRRVSREL